MISFVNVYPSFTLPVQPFVLGKPCNYEPESDAGTTAPARAETSQLGALDSQLCSSDCLE